MPQLKTVILPPGTVALPSPREIWLARDVLIQFGKRDVLLRYRQTLVGVAWVVLQPLASAGIFAIVFGAVAGLPSGDVPYFVFSFAGMLAWNLFSGIVSRASGSMVSNQALVSKVYFPRLLVPLSTAMSALLDFAVAFVLFVVLLLIYGINPGWSVLLTPVWVLTTVLLALGVGVAASAATVLYRDLNYALPWILQLLLYGTPIAYSLSAVPAHLLWLFNLNPLTWMIQAYRWSLLGAAMPPTWQLLSLVGVSVVVFAGGVLLFQKLERGFADVI